MDEQKRQFLDKVDKHVSERIRTILKRPQMYSATAENLEDLVLGTYSIGHAMHIGFDADLDSPTISEAWAKFANAEVGYKGNRPVAIYLHDHRLLDDQWSVLIELLAKFCKIER